MQRTALALIVHFTAIGPTPHLLPLLSFTGWLPTNESWLSRARIGWPVDPRKTKPGSPIPCPFGGAGTDLALQSSCIGGELGGWIAMPHVTCPSRAVHNCAPEVDARAGAHRLSTPAPSSNPSRYTATSSHILEPKSYGAVAAHLLWSRLHRKQDVDHLNRMMHFHRVRRNLIAHELQAHALHSE
jgi:hypothetical protein